MYFLIKKCVQQWYNNSVFKKEISILICYFFLNLTNVHITITSRKLMIIYKWANVYPFKIAKTIYYQDAHNPTYFFIFPA